jgi:hypothetical protein
MIVIGTERVERYFAARAGHKAIKAARSQYDVWRRSLHGRNGERPRM